MRSRVMYLTAVIVCALGMTACAGEKGKDLSVQPEGTGAELQGNVSQEGRMPEAEEQEPESQKSVTELGQEPEAAAGPEQSGQETGTGQEPVSREPEAAAGPEQSGQGTAAEQESAPAGETDGEYGIRFDESTETYEAEDGTVLLTVETSFPVLTIPAHEQVAETINRYVRQDGIFGGDGMEGMTVQEVLQWAEEDYQARGKDSWYANYSLYKGYGLQRMDDDAVSFILEVYAYTGGAHPNTMLYGLTFDTQTGERLSLVDVVENEEAASAAVLRFLLEETGKEKYQGAFFSGYEETLSRLLREGTWYFGEDGFHIIANTYEIAPYVAGSFDFVIPYEQADFLKERYLKKAS